jgi:hypothetical protein
MDGTNSLYGRERGFDQGCGDGYSDFLHVLLQITKRSMSCDQCNASKFLVGMQRWETQVQLGFLGDNVLSKGLRRHGLLRHRAFQLCDVSSASMAHTLEPRDTNL